MNHITEAARNAKESSCMTEVDQEGNVTAEVYLGEAEGYQIWAHWLLQSGANFPVATFTLLDSNGNETMVAGVDSLLAWVDNAGHE